MVKGRRGEIRCLHATLYLGTFPPEEKIVRKSFVVNLEKEELLAKSQRPLESDCTWERDEKWVKK
jgi:hypothetical protein